MANEEHLQIIRRGVDVWNEWRQKNREIREPDLRGEKLCGANLRGAILYKANLTRAILAGANLRGASLIKANLSNADLGGADLRWAQIIGTKLLGTTLTGSRVYGAAVWDIKVNARTKQQNLIITDGADRNTKCSLRSAAWHRSCESLVH